MKRRSFLALLASAPLGALAPLPKILEQRRLSNVTDQWTFDTSVVRQPPLGALRLDTKSTTPQRQPRTSLQE